ncbi:putative E3 ubiquitin-protein ligase ARI8, partial [Silene latifolia]|uniref:putative E3 ubiquitin-protein ligase ARI8 n=1 Tax=Silene latifolia TaxID=37657 RepID=UPI003D77BB3D
ECNSSWFDNTHICPQAKLKAIVEDENKREKARNDYDRYQECLSLWNFQNTEQNQVLMKLRSMQNEELKAVAENQALALGELSFVTDAWLQAVECKRVFKYICVSNFYFHIFQENPLCNDLIKNGAFVLEQLCLVAAELRMLVSKTVPVQQFEDFRKRLCLMTSVARNYFQNMEIAIKNEYTDIKTLRLVICSRESIERKTDSTEELKEWTCPHCSFSNDASTTVCVMCYH